MKKLIKTSVIILGIVLILTSLIYSVNAVNISGSANRRRENITYTFDDEDLVIYRDNESNKDNYTTVVNLYNELIEHYRTCSVCGENGEKWTWYEYRKDDDDYYRTVAKFDATVILEDCTAGSKWNQLLRLIAKDSANTINSFNFEKVTWGTIITNLTQEDGWYDQYVEHYLSSGIRGGVTISTLMDMLNNPTSGYYPAQILSKFVSVFCLQHGTYLATEGSGYLSRDHFSSIQISNYITVTWNDYNTYPTGPNLNSYFFNSFYAVDYFDDYESGSYYTKSSTTGSVSDLVTGLNLDEESDKIEVNEEIEVSEETFGEVTIAIDDSLTTVDTESEFLVSGGWTYGSGSGSSGTYKQGNWSTKTRYVNSNQTFQYKAVDLDNVTTNYAYNVDIDVRYAVTFSEKYLSQYSISGSTGYLGYGYEPTQMAIWGNTNGLGMFSPLADDYSTDNGDEGTEIWGYDDITGSNSYMLDLYRANAAFVDYDEDAQDSDIGTSPTVSKHTDTGTILDDYNTSTKVATYTVGPFDMSDYAYADSSYVEEYSGQFTSNGEEMIYKTLLGGIISGYVKVSNDAGTSTKTLEVSDSSSWNTSSKSGTVKIVYASTSDEGDNNRSGDYWEAPDDYLFPWPNSTFYIEIQLPLDYTQITEIGFEYRQTTAEGSGWVIESYYVQSKFKVVDGSETSTTYTYSGSHGVSSSADYDWYYISDDITTSDKKTSGTYTCTHYYYKNEYDDEGNYTGYHLVDTKSHTVSVANWINKSTGHVLNIQAYWDFVTSYLVNGQPMLAVHDATVTVKSSVYKFTTPIRLTTDVSINKYIYDVDHDKSYDGYDSTQYISNSTARASLTETQKESNPVYVEYGDIITFKIVLTNEQTQAVKVKIKDEWSSNCTYVSGSLSITGSGISYAVNNGKHWWYVKGSSTGASSGTTGWIVVPGASNSSTPGVVTITYKLKVNSHTTTSIWENSATIITRNGTSKGAIEYNSSNTATNIDEVSNVDYVYTYDKTNSLYGTVVNIAELTNENLTSSDYHKLNDYNATLDKYISSYTSTVTTSNNTDKLTNESTTLADRYSMTETQKNNAPLSVEKTDRLVYSIRITNDSALTSNSTTSTGTKAKTAVRPTQIQETLDEGLKYVSMYAVIYTYNSTTGAYENKYGQNIPITVQNSGQVYTFTLRSNTITKNGSTKMIMLDPGEYIVYYVTVDVTESNMSLDVLTNTATITKLTNVNDVQTGTGTGAENSRLIQNTTVVPNVNENISTQQTSSDYVMMKDLVISGKVWLDTNQDGYMPTDDDGNITIATGSSAIDVTTNPSTYLSDSDATEYAMKGIVVNLYRVGTGSGGVNGTDELVRTTVTDENGLFTFGRQSDGSTYYSGTYSASASGVTISNQRIDKASNKDANTYKYNTNSDDTNASKLYSYYVEYVYDGLVYKSTELYSGTDNLGNQGEIKDGYTTDSNAEEFSDERDEFNENYEIISYNSSYTEDGTRSDTLSYDKETNTHASYINENDDREMHSYSFMLDYDIDEIIYALSKVKGKDDGSGGCGATKWKSCNAHWQYWKVLIDAGFIDETAYENNASGREDAKKEARRLYTIYTELKAEGYTEAEAINYLWLYKQSTEYEYPETEYLKYINLGLELRENVDISITQDVYEIETTTNGEQMTYEYNQNSYTRSGDSTVDTTSSDVTIYNSRYYMTGNNSVSATSAVEQFYEFQLYQSDYNYRVSQYSVETVREYKGEESELNVQVAYRIRVTNNSITRDEPESSDLSSYKDVKVYTGINEIVEYYDTDYVSFGTDSNGNVNTITIKTYDDDTGYLVDTKLDCVKAYYYITSGGKVYIAEATLSTSSIYGTTRDLSTYGYSSLYIRPTTGLSSTNTSLQSLKVYDVETGEVVTDDNGNEIDLILEEGESIDVIITFQVKDDKESDADSEYTKVLGEKLAVAEISAYSTYYKNDDGTFKSAGLVDMDSNPGNFGDAYKEISSNGTETTVQNVNSSAYFKYYEDDTFKTGIEISVQNGTPDDPDDPDDPDNPDDPNEPPGDPDEPPGDPGQERAITGVVWDDARSKSITDDEGTQYAGNGKYNTNDTANENAKTNESVDETNDTPVEGVTVQLIESIEIPIDSSGNVVTTSTDTVESYRIYEQTIYANGEKDDTSDIYSVMKVKTGSDGTYKLEGFIPGTYLVRFYYGNEETEDMLIYNGQDYKSTTYQSGVSTYAENASSTDDTLETLEKAKLSDAKDDEIRRLEVISYSETMTNATTVVLRGENTSDAEELVENTNMYADTTEFLVRTEKENSDVTSLPFDDVMEKFGKNVDSDSGTLETVDREANERDKIQNIDFGLEYRPEVQVDLDKYISELTITTSDGDTLVKMVYDTYYGIVSKTDTTSGTTEFLADNSGEIIEVSADATKSEIETAAAGVSGLSDCEQDADNYVVAVAGTKLNEEKSIGLDNVMFVETTEELEKDSDGNYEIDDETGYYKVDTDQGFVYLNIDDDIMQGSTVTINYLFVSNNISEVDRVSENLSDIRYEGNDATETYYTKSDGTVNSTSYNELDVQKAMAGSSASVSDDIDVSEVVEETDYTFTTSYYSAAITARNYLFSEYFRYELDSSGNLNKDDNGDVVLYKVKYKDLNVVNGKTNYAEYNTGNNSTNNASYYGRYLGSTYYLGKIGKKDTVADVKIDRILDYVDTDLTFATSENQEQNSYWAVATNEELVTSGWVSITSMLDTSKAVTDATSGKTSVTSTITELNAAIDTINANLTNQAVSALDSVKAINSSSLSSSSGLVGNIIVWNAAATTTDLDNLLGMSLRFVNSDSVQYATDEISNLALLVDDRKSDDSDDGVINTEVKYLSPRCSDASSSYGIVNLVTTKVISSEDDTSDTTYDNVAEIVQYSTVTGRVTNPATTLGNFSILKIETDEENDEVTVTVGDLSEFDVSTFESDTASVEKVTLTPPTGLSQTEQIVQNVVKGASYTVVIIIAVAAIMVISLGCVRIYHKKHKIK